MILLDTNVVSELMKSAPDRLVIEWLNRQDSGSLHLSAVTVGEIVYGLSILPDGRRRERLRERFRLFVSRAFEGRIHPYDDAAATVYSELMGARRKSGRPMSLPDGQIAAIVHVLGMTIATRNVKDSDACGVAVINPFQAEP